jgi:hypothetical protein
MLFGEQGSPKARHLYSMSETEAFPVGPPQAVPIRLFGGEVLGDSVVSERLGYEDDIFPPHRTGSYGAYWNCVSWVPVIKGGSCLCEHGPSAEFEHDAEKVGPVVWLGK